MDFTSKFLGLTLKNPLVPSASPLSHSIDMARQLEDAGAAALVMYSLFEEAVSREEESMVHFLHHQEIGFGEAQDFLPAHIDFDNALDLYLENLRQLKQALDIPVVASLNGITPGGWIEHATTLEKEGADALELNVYYLPNNVETSSDEVERRYLELLTELRGKVKIPINMKLSPYFSALGHTIKAIEAAGANGVALFNRFYQPDIDIDSLRLNHRLHLSSSAEHLLSMHWIAILHGHTDLTLGATSVVHNTEDALKMLLAGADVVHLCSALLKRGPVVLGEILAGMEAWMEEKGFESIEEFQGMMSQRSVADPGVYERINYMKSLDSFGWKG